MFVGILPTINGRPLSMNAYVSLLVIDTDIDIKLDTTLHLSRNDAAGRWEGTVVDGDVQTTVTISDTASPVVFEAAASATNMGLPLTQAQWAHTQAVDDDRWDSGVLERIHNLGLNEVRLRVLA